MKIPIGDFILNVKKGGFKKENWFNYRVIHGLDRSNLWQAENQFMDLYTQQHRIGTGVEQRD